MIRFIEDGTTVYFFTERRGYVLQTPKRQYSWSSEFLAWLTPANWKFVTDDYGQMVRVL